MTRRRNLPRSLSRKTRPIFDHHVAPLVAAVRVNLLMSCHALTDVTFRIAEGRLRARLMPPTDGVKCCPATRWRMVPFCGVIPGHRAPSGEESEHELPGD